MTCIILPCCAVTCGWFQVRKEAGIIMIDWGTLSKLLSLSEPSLLISKMRITLFPNPDIVLRIKWVNICKAPGVGSGTDQMLLSAVAMWLSYICYGGGTPGCDEETWGRAVRRPGSLSLLHHALAVCLKEVTDFFWVSVSSFVKWGWLYTPQKAVMRTEGGKCVRVWPSTEPGPY